MYNGASTRKFMTGDNSSGVIVYSIAEDAKGVVLGTSDGFYRPDFGTGSLKRVYGDIDMCVNSIIKYDNGLLAGTEKGLYRLGGKASDKDFSLELFGVDEDTEVNDICADGRDLYIVTPNDLLIYSGKTRRAGKGPQDLFALLAQRHYCRQRVQAYGCGKQRHHVGGGRQQRQHICGN